MAVGKSPQNPFYSLVPDMLMIPMIVLSIIAAIIASRAIIAGIFSVTRQGYGSCCLRHRFVTRARCRKGRYTSP